MYVILGCISLGQDLRYLNEPHVTCGWDSHHLYGMMRPHMETFSALLALCVWKSPVTGEFPSQRPVTWGYNIFFDLRLNKRLSKESGRRWFETPSRSLWRHYNDFLSSCSTPFGVTRPHWHKLMYIMHTCCIVQWWILFKKTSLYPRIEKEMLINIVK